MDKEYNPGEIIEHKLSKEWVMVLNYNAKERVYTCRTKSFDEKQFHDFELQEKRK